ncbi:MAG: hypothetical protein F4114_16640 [Rhodospirillaceae bacterium]|nr:hypothetical protein [Rhodospirillaceae bacterium]MYB13585.1 hypothetical protein [Rhodospirillaceae bacterium]MYI50697.1 hypothetical protein [Rhodospirillaceae bacterium]
MSEPPPLSAPPPPQDAPGTEIALPPLDRQAVEAIFGDAVRRYIAGRRARIPAFVDRNFGLRGSLELHRRALGLDLVRASYNVMAGVATAARGVGAAGLRAAGAREAADRLPGRNLFWKTQVARELEWRLHTDFLELPLDQTSDGGDRRTDRDRLVEEALSDPRLAAHFDRMLKIVGDRAGDRAFRDRVHAAMQDYLGSRAAAADITASLFAAGAGYIAAQKFTPGAAALSGVVAGSIAHSAAVGSFFAGPWLGGLYYSLVSVKVSPLLYAGVFAGMLVPLAMLTAFAGVVADPVQRSLGLHERRLNRLLDVLEANLAGESDAGFGARDHYVARLMDLLDWSASIVRLAGAR